MRSIVEKAHEELNLLSDYPKTGYIAIGVVIKNRKASYRDNDDRTHRGPEGGPIPGLSKTVYDLSLDPCYGADRMRHYDPGDHPGDRVDLEPNRRAGDHIRRSDLQDTMSPRGFTGAAAQGQIHEGRVSGPKRAGVSDQQLDWYRLWRVFRLQEWGGL